MVGRDSVEPHFERSEASRVSILPWPALAFPVSALATARLRCYFGRTMKKLFIAVLFGLLLSTNSVHAGEEYGWRFIGVTVDIFIARPFTFAATLLGGALWTVSLPITAPTCTSQDSFDTLVRTPWDLTFDRALGDYEK